MADYTLIQRMVDGEFPLDNDSDHKGEISATFFYKIETSGVTFEALLNTKLDNIGRIHMFKRFFEWVPYSEKDLSVYRKNAATASILREIGKAAHLQKHLKEALKYYNFAVAYAPYPSKTSECSEQGTPPLIQYLAERSSVLLQARGGEEALRDIKFIFKLLDENVSKPESHEELRKELQERKESCEKFLEEKASFMQELAKDSLEEMEKRRKYRNLLLFRVKTPSPVLPAAENFVEIKVDPVKGRQLVVNRDIPAGTTVVVEEPYVKVLKNGLKWDLDHCHYCFVKIRGGGGIPCPGCIFEVYCSQSCLEEAYSKYHKYECPCMSYLHYTSTPRYIHLAFRIICTVGPKELYRLFITKDPKFFLPGNGNKKDVTILGSNSETKVYESLSYLPIFHLISHSGSNNNNVNGNNNKKSKNRGKSLVEEQPQQMDTEEVEYFTNVIQGLIYANILEKMTPFYSQGINYVSTHPQEYFKTFVASIILHHIENIPCNSISVDELVGLEGISLLVKEPTILQERIRSLQLPQYGSAVYSTSSLINHSCDPNVTRIFDLTQGRMALVTLKGLKSGEELLTSYTKIFLSDTVEERKDYLCKTYKFECNCIACIQKWPILAKISETEPKFCCATCTKKFGSGERGIGGGGGGNSAFARCILDKKGYCRGCKKGHDLMEIRDQLDTKIENFFEVYDLITKNKPFEAIRLLGPCMQFFQDNVSPPYNKIYMSQDLLKTALDLIVHYSVPRT